MKKHSENTITIKTNLNFPVVFEFILSVSLIGLVVFMYTVFKLEGTLIEYLFFGFLILIAIIFIGVGFVINQKAIISAAGIKFKWSFGIITVVSWDAIVKIDIQNLDTLQSTFATYKYKWIVLYTDLNQKPKGGGGNWRKAPYTIKATQKNIEIIKNYAKQYAKNAIIDM